MRWRSYVWLTTGMALFGTATPTARLVVEAVPPLVGGALRVALAAAILVPLAARRGHPPWRVERSDWFAVALLAIVGMFGFTAFLAFGMARIEGATGSIIMGTAPAVTAIAGIIVLRESPTWRRLAAVALAAAGLVILRWGGDLGFDLGGAALVFGAVAAEATYTLAGKHLSGDHTPVTMTALAVFWSLPLFAAGAALQWHDVRWDSVEPTHAVAIGLWAFGALALGSVVWYHGVKKVPGHVAAGFMGVMPVSALAISYVVLGESPQWLHLPGVLLVLAAIAVLAWDDRSNA